MAKELVYLIQGGPYYKIGRTTKLEERVNAIQTSHPHRLVVLRTWEVIDSAAIEAYLHKRFSVVKMVGEWFQLSKIDLDTLMSMEEWPVEQRPPEARRQLSVPVAPGSLRALLESKGFHTCAQFGNTLNFTRQQAWALWHGKTTLGLRLAKRIAEATKIPLDEIAEVNEAVPGQPRARKRQEP